MMMFYKTLAAAAGLAALTAGSAQAATFDGYETTRDVYFDGAAELVYDFGIGSIFDDGTGDIVLNIEFEDLGGAGQAGSAGTFDFITFDEYFGALIDYMFTDNASGDDELALLFQTDIGGGPTDFAIGTFTGELGSSFLVDGADAMGTFTLVGAGQMTPIPLPAGLPLMLAGLGSLAWVRRRKG